MLYQRQNRGAAQHAALAVDVLGGGIDDDVGAKLQRLLQHRRGEHIVDPHLGPDLLGERAAGRDVAFYAAKKSVVPEMREALRKFATTLPSRVALDIESSDCAKLVK